MVLNHIITIKSEDLDDDLPSWKWLQHLIKTLGEDGMSSEESSVENSVMNVLWVKNMNWRRNIEKELEIIDLHVTTPWPHRTPWPFRNSSAGNRTLTHSSTALLSLLLCVPRSLSAYSNYVPLYLRLLLLLFHSDYLSYLVPFID